VGESGCGKSTLVRTIVRLYEPSAGKVFFENIEISSLRGEVLRKTRRRIQMIFQDPYASLNPRMRVRSVLKEPLHEHGLSWGVDADAKVREMMNMVGLNPDFANRFPHEFSGGQRQRIGIARALVLEPSLVICDEPISALDVSVQAQIINLLEDLQKELNLSYLFVAHDLSMIRHISKRVAIMYLGALVELGTKDAVYAKPLHPYTQALLSVAPIPNPRSERMRKRILLTGELPSPINPPAGCRFHTRCKYALDVCRRELPPMRELSPGHSAACHRAGEAGIGT
jgi:oligopeptide transport system ATP-binding protein